MNISGPPSFSRSQGNASRTNSLGGASRVPQASRSSSAKLIPQNDSQQQPQQQQQQHAGYSPTGVKNRSGKSEAVPAHSFNSSSSLVRLSSDESYNSAKSVGPSLHAIRTKSLNLESSKKLDQFVDNVKSQQSPMQSPASPRNRNNQAGLGKRVASSKSLKHLGALLGSETPTSTDKKKRLVDQFYEDNTVSSNNTANATGNTDNINHSSNTTTPKGGNGTPARNNSLNTSSDEVLSSITPTLITKNVFNEYHADEPPPLNSPPMAGNFNSTFGVRNISNASAEHSNSVNGGDNKTGETYHISNIDRQILALKYQAINDVKTVVNQSEMLSIVLLNKIEQKKAEIKSLSSQLTTTYADLKKNVLNLDETHYEKYSSNEKLDYSKVLKESDAELHKYRDIITEEKKLFKLIDEDLKILEVMTMEKLERARSNRNKIALVVLLISVLVGLYLLYIDKNK